MHVSVHIVHMHACPVELQQNMHIMHVLLLLPHDMQSLLDLHLARHLRLLTASVTVAEFLRSDNPPLFLAVLRRRPKTSLRPCLLSAEVDHRPQIC